MAEDVEIGRVGDYFAHIGVAGIDLKGPLKVGDRIRIKGHTTDLEIEVASMPEMTRRKVREAEPFPVLKIKVGLDTDEATLEAVRSLTKKPLRVTGCRPR